MLIPLGRRAFFSYLFIILGLGSSIYIVTAALNYDELYPSLGQLEFQVTGLSYQSGSPAYLQSTLKFMNPSAYTGFAVSQVSVDIYFFNSSAAIFATPLDPTISHSQVLNTQLPSHSETSVQVSARLETSQASELQDFYNASSGNVTGHIRLTVHVSTFLDAVTGAISMEQSQNVTLT